MTLRIQLTHPTDENNIYELELNETDLILGVFSQELIKTPVPEDSIQKEI